MAVKLMPTFYKMIPNTLIDACQPRVNSQQNGAKILAKVTMSMRFIPSVVDWQTHLSESFNF